MSNIRVTHIHALRHILKYLKTETKDSMNNQNEKWKKNTKRKKNKKREAGRNEEEEEELKKSTKEGKHDEEEEEREEDIQTKWKVNVCSVRLLIGVRMFMCLQRNLLPIIVIHTHTLSHPTYARTQSHMDKYLCIGGVRMHIARCIGGILSYSNTKSTHTNPFNWTMYNI